MNSKKHGSTSRVRITIPGFDRVVRQGKEYTVYKIVIAKPGGQKEIEKRYSEFYMLNKKLKDSRQLPHGVVQFPPKRLNTGSKATKEERRVKLEKYLQVLCTQDPIAAEVLAFLTISQPQSIETTETSTSSSEDLLSLSSHSSHQPIIGFLYDPFVDEITNSKATLQDVLIHGILDGLYEI